MPGPRMGFAEGSTYTPEMPNSPYETIDGLEMGVEALAFLKAGEVILDKIRKMLGYDQEKGK